MRSGRGLHGTDEPALLPQAVDERLQRVEQKPERVPTTGIGPARPIELPMVLGSGDIVVVAEGMGARRRHTFPRKDHELGQSGGPPVSVVERVDPRDEFAAPGKASPDLRIGEVEGEDPYLLSWVPSIATDPDGRVIVVDQGSRQVRVLDRDGRFLFHFGGPGEGPGEMEWPPCCVGFAPDGRLWVRERFRYHAFVLEEGGARYEGGLTRHTGHRAAPITFDSAGRLIDVGSIMVGGRPVNARFHMGPGTAVDTVHVGTVEEQLTGRAWFTEGRMMTLVEQPYGPRWLVAHGPGGAWGVASSSEYSVTLHQPDGNTLRIDGPPGPGPALTTSERDSAQADLDDQLEGLRGDAPFGVPDHKPPLAAIFFDRGGRLWVEKTAVRGDGMREADVYDEGVLVARYRWPRHVDLGHLPWVTASALYGTTRDELDVVRVVRVQFEPARSN